jgi:hypothetical protein
MEENIKYSSIRFATKTIKDRQYKDFKNIIIANKSILCKDINYIEIKLKSDDKIYNCLFI